MFCQKVPFVHGLGIPVLAVLPEKFVSPLIQFITEEHSKFSGQHFKLFRILYGSGNLLIGDQI